MQLIVVDTNPTVCDAMRSVIPDADVRNCRLDEIRLDEYDVLFTPGNSYGFMDGGFDRAVRDRFPGVEQQVQRTIKDYYGGLLAVGQAFAVHSGHPNQFVVYAPTMWVPKPIYNTDNVYLATRAAMMAVRALVETKQVPPHRGLRILTPAFGTSAGQMVYANAAHQMRMGIQHGLRTKEEIEAAHTWAYGWADHNAVQPFK